MHEMTGTTPLRDGSVPKHIQLRDALTQLCRTELSPDRAIPSERELMHRYAVSRATVRAAIGALVHEGLLLRTHGKGTFVARPRVQSQLHLASFTDDMRRRGHTPSTRVLHLALEVPPPDVAEFLGTSGRPQWRVARTRLADDLPMAHEDGWYSADLLPDLGRHDVAGSLYELFRTCYDIAVDSAEQTVWAESAESRVATALDLPAGSPVLVFDRRSRAGERPLERVVSRYRADRYQLHMALDRSMPAEQVTP
jgi:GntR family transcriptional regulator